MFNNGDGKWRRRMKERKENINFWSKESDWLMLNNKRPTPIGWLLNEVISKQEVYCRLLWCAQFLKQ